MFSAKLGAHEDVCKEFQQSIGRVSGFSLKMRLLSAFQSRPGWRRWSTADDQRISAKLTQLITSRTVLVAGWSLDEKWWLFYRHLIKWYLWMHIDGLQKDWIEQGMKFESPRRFAYLKLLKLRPRRRCQATYASNLLQSWYHKAPHFQGKTTVW